MSDLVQRAKAYLAYPPANFPDGVSLLREFVAASGECGCSDPDAAQCGKQDYGNTVEQRDGICVCACHGH
jgi:hypothetical protein